MERVMIIIAIVLLLLNHALELQMSIRDGDRTQRIISTVGVICSAGWLISDLALWVRGVGA